jgi:hypothetical protein
MPAALGQQREAVGSLRASICPVVAQAAARAVAGVGHQQSGCAQRGSGARMVGERPDQPQRRTRLVHRMQVQQPLAAFHHRLQFQHAPVLRTPSPAVLPPAHVAP